MTKKENNTARNLYGDNYFAKEAKKALNNSAIYFFIALCLSIMFMMSM